MKRKFFFSVCFALFLFNSSMYSQQNTNLVWSKSLGGTFDDVPVNLHEIDGGGFYLTGMSESSDFDITNNNGYLDFIVFKFNDEHQIDWQVSVGSTTGEWLNGSYLTSDMKLLLFGFAYDLDDAVFNAKVVKLNDAGDIVWDHEYGGSDFEEFTYAFETDDAYVLVAETYSNDGDSQHNFTTDLHSWILFLNKDTGDILNSIVLPIDILDEFSLDKVVKLSNGDFIFAGYPQGVYDEVNDTVTYDSKLFFYKYNADFELISTYEVESTCVGCADFVSRIKDVFVLENDKLAIVGRFLQEEDFDSGSFRLLTVSSDFDLFTDVFFAIPNNVSFASNIIKTTEGYAVISSLNDDVSVFRLSETGSLINEITYGTNGIDGIGDFCQIIQKQNGNLFLASDYEYVGGSTPDPNGLFTNYHGGQDIAIFEVSLDALGIDLPLMSDMIKIYPNPTNGIIQIMSEVSLDQAEISVFDMSGRKVYHSQNNNNNIIDLSSLSPNNYMLSIKTNEFTHQAKFIKY